MPIMNNERWEKACNTWTLMTPSRISLAGASTQGVLGEEGCGHPLRAAGEWGADAPRGPGTRCLTQGAPMPARLPAAPFFSFWRHGQAGGKRGKRSKRGRQPSSSPSSWGGTVYNLCVKSGYIAESHLALTCVGLHDQDSKGDSSCIYRID